MRVYKVKNIDHLVFDNVEEVPENIEYLGDWRECHISDWVLADDGCVIQVLRKGAMMKPKGKVREVKYIGTCTGTFVVSEKTKMDTSKRCNIYSIGGNIERKERESIREKTTSNEELFVLYIASGMSPQEAYVRVFPTNNPGYAKVKAGQLIKTTRIKTAMKEELKPVLEELGIDEKVVLKGIKDMSELSQKEDTKLKALFKLSDILDLEDKTRTSVQQISGAVFQGFSKEQLEDVKRKELK